jgi:hypothetical protein
VIGEVAAYQIPRDQVLDYWDRVKHWLDIAYGKNDIPLPETTLTDMLNGHKQLWVPYAHEPENRVLGAVLTRLARMRSGLYCEIVAAGGHEVERWVGLISQIEDWARLEGCTKVTITGRPGWMRLLTKYRQHQVMLELEL